jgi:hypothetical protein
VIRASLLISGVLLSTAAMAIDVFRWVDADGVTHFADTPPPHAPAVSALVVPDRNPPDYDPATDPYSVLAQARRTREALAAQQAARASQADAAPPVTNMIVLPPPPTDTLVWYRPGIPAFHPPVNLPWPPTSPNAQLRALEQAGLTGRRPVSINSSRHAARVEASRALPVLASEPVPVPLPQQP